MALNWCSQILEEQILNDEPKTSKSKWGGRKLAVIDNAFGMTLLRPRLLLALVLLSQFALTGCLALVIREDDEAPTVAGKVMVRTLIAIPTLGFSEVGIAEEKATEESRPLIVTSGSHNLATMKTSPVNRPRAVVVWGNHPAAVGPIVDLVQSQGNTVLERTRLQSVFDEQKIRLTHSSDDMADLLKVGKIVGADSIIFADVSHRAETRSGVYNTPGAILPMGGMLLAVPPKSESYSETLHHISVAVRGVNVEDGTVRWSGSATVNQPVKNPDAAVGYLTNAAILRALCRVEKGYEWVEQGPWRKWGCLKKGE